MSKDDLDDSSLEDPLLWCRSLDKHSYGEFSFAVVQANEVLEDQSQVETGRDATFVGVYDGHGGPDASRFISDHLFLHLMSEPLSSWFLVFGFFLFFFFLAFLGIVGVVCNFVNLCVCFFF